MHAASALRGRAFTAYTISTMDEIVSPLTIHEAIDAAAVKLNYAEIDEPRREAASLLSAITSLPGAFIFAHPEHQLNADEIDRYVKAVSRRAAREPFHYITGTKEFFGLDFKIGPGVLIPRPETELMVEEAIHVLSSLNSPRFLEIGVGSGCISISILRNVDDAAAVGIDISPKAMDLASHNSAAHGVNDRFDIRLGDVYGGINESFDLIVSNPPYIPSGDLSSLQPEVRDHEPHIALFSGGDGLSMIEQLIEGAPRYLKSSGTLLIEIGAGQAKTVEAMFSEDIWETVVFLADLQGIERIVNAKLNGR